MGAGSPDSIRQVAERGYNLLLDQFASFDAVAERIAIFKAEVEQRGRVFDPMDVGVARAFYVAKDEADKEAALERRLEAQRRLDAISKRAGREEHREHHDLFRHPRGERRERALWHARRDRGEARTLRKLGVEYVLLNGGGLARDSLRRFAREVMPHFAGSAKMRSVG